MSATDLLPVARPALTPAPANQDCRGGDVSRPVRQRATVSQRFAAVVVAALCGAIWVTAARLRPDPRGLGTHERLGAWPCGVLVSTGIPCPTCGMTTAFSQLAHGHPLAALRAQPAGFIIALLTLVAGLTAFRVAFVGRVPNLPLERLARPGGLMILAAVFFGGWAWKVADFLRHSR